jgi:hypothetical protein
MRRSLHFALWSAFCLTWRADGAPAQPVVEPPGDAAVLRALARPAAGVCRDDIVIVKEQVGPGQWKCTAYYTESIWLPWGRVPLGNRVQVVLIPRMGHAAACQWYDRA